MTDDGAGPIRPDVTPQSAAFWAGCAEGRLLVMRCAACEAFIHPPVPGCPTCGGPDVAPAEVSPAGTVYSLTVSHQSLRPDLESPYAVVLVDLTEAPGVRLTLRVVGTPPADVQIGDAVRIGFEDHADGFAVPVAEVVGGGHATHHTEPGRLTAPRWSGAKPESGAVISGLGRSAIGRNLARSDIDLVLEAARAAIADAGLRPGDVDGIAAYPGAGLGPPGYAGPATDAVAAALGLGLRWHRAGAEGAGQLQPVMDAVLAVAAGLCDHALVYRGATESTAVADMRAGRRPAPTPAPAGGFTEWLLPFDAVTPAHWLAPYAARHQHQFGTTRAQLGAVAMAAREHAERHPLAVMREPLTLDEYLLARPISRPLHLLDCDVPVDGAVAVVVSRAEAAGDLPGPAVRFEAMGTGVGWRPGWHDWPDLTTMAAHGAAATMWARTDLGPADVDVAQLYDGFSFLALYWLEALGFCDHGDGGPFVEEAGRLGLGGDLPTNTGGGQLSGGRLHGWGLLAEAVEQLRGTALGGRVVDADVAVVTTGGGPVAGCLLLTR